MAPHKDLIKCRVTTVVLWGPPQLATVSQNTATSVKKCDIKGPLTPTWDPCTPGLFSFWEVQEHLKFHLKRPRYLQRAFEAIYLDINSRNTAVQLPPAAVFSSPLFSSQWPRQQRAFGVFSFHPGWPSKLWVEPTVSPKTCWVEGSLLVRILEAFWLG